MMFPALRVQRSIEVSVCDPYFADRSKTERGFGWFKIKIDVFVPSEFVFYFVNLNKNFIAAPEKQKNFRTKQKDDKE